MAQGLGDWESEALCERGSEQEPGPGVQRFELQVISILDPHDRAAQGTTTELGCDLRRPPALASDDHEDEVFHVITPIEFVEGGEHGELILPGFDGTHHEHVPAPPDLRKLGNQLARHPILEIRRQADLVDRRL